MPVRERVPEEFQVKRRVSGPALPPLEKEIRPHAPVVELLERNLLPR